MKLSKLGFFAKNSDVEKNISICGNVDLRTYMYNHIIQNLIKNEVIKTSKDIIDTINKQNNKNSIITDNSILNSCDILKEFDWSFYQINIPKIKNMDLYYIGLGCKYLIFFDEILINYKIKNDTIYFGYDVVNLDVFKIIK